MSKSGEVVVGWHFLADDGKLGNSDGRKPRKGAWVKMREDEEPVLCECGMHASLRAIDALWYAPGAILCRVEVRGDVVHGDDKFVGRERRIIAKADATRMLHEFACDCAEKALKAAQVTDPRSWAAIETKRRWLDKKATDEELATARAAARDAAWAAGAAAGAAARAAARDAAWAAARDAAGAAAWASAWASAGDYSRAAAWTAARDAARTAARAAQGVDLEARAYALIGGTK
jgi:hypothetical protein